MHTYEQKPQLILLHGALGSRQEMQRIESQFSPYFEVFSFDFVGHGESAGKPFTIQSLVEQLKNEVEANGWKNFSIFGYSMGGYVAMKYALEEYDNLKQVFTYGTKWNWSPEFSESESAKLNPDAIAEKHPQFAAYLKNLHGEAWKEVMLNTGKMMKDLSHDHLSEQDLSSIQCFVQIALGEKDKMVEVEESIKMTERLNQSRFSVIQNAGHNIQTVEDSQWDEIRKSMEN